MAILEVLKWTTFSTTTEESTSTEGKAGVPRFDGDPARLSEYAFRVRLRQARELSMAEDEVKKLGPLALRLVDGLRGAALQVARTLPVDELANKEKGVEFLLKSLNSSLAPRSKQEARDLYQAGAQNGGILSRQRGESIASYVLRRRAWYRMMTDLDPDLKLPTGILAEQLLMNAGISDDHRLLIRTAIKGDMDWEKVCEELMWLSIAGSTRKRRAAVLERATSPQLSRALEKGATHPKASGAPTTWRMTTSRKHGRALHSPLVAMRTTSTTPLCTMPRLRSPTWMTATPSTWPIRRWLMKVLMKKTQKRSSMRLISFRLNQRPIMRGCAHSPQATMASGARDMADNTKSMEALAWRRRDSASRR